MDDPRETDSVTGSPRFALTIHGDAELSAKGGVDGGWQ